MDPTQNLLTVLCSLRDDVGKLEICFDPTYAIGLSKCSKGIKPVSPKSRVRLYISTLCGNMVKKCWEGPRSGSLCVCYRSS